MFKQSEIGKKCSCNDGEVVCKEHDSKRYLVPAGYYGERYQSAEYYLAVWWSLRCEQCGNERNDFFVWKWHKDGSGSPVDGFRLDNKYQRRYPDIYKAIRQMMAD